MNKIVESEKPSKQNPLAKDYNKVLGSVDF